MLSWQTRRLIGYAGQTEFKALLRANGFRSWRVGQESLLDDSVVAMLRYARDPMSRAIKHMPDLLAFRSDFGLLYFDVMVNTTPGTENFAIEKTKFEELMARTAKGERVAVAWGDDGRWLVNWVTALLVFASPSRLTSRGSQAPFALVEKASTVEFAGWVKENGNRQA